MLVARAGYGRGGRSGRRAQSSAGVAHLSSFSRKRSGTKEAVQPSQLRKQSLVGSTLDGWTTKVDIRCWRSWRSHTPTGLGIRPASLGDGRPALGD